MAMGVAFKIHSTRHTVLHTVLYFQWYVDVYLPGKPELIASTTFTDVFSISDGYFILFQDQDEFGKLQ